MLNEFVYCPRLFYYEHVLGVFVENADTVRGSLVHERVDCGKGGLPAKSKEPSQAPLETIHSHSVMLGSDRLGVVAKMDLVEVTVDQAGNAEAVSPVDYKAGAPRECADGIALWDTDRMQLGIQCLVLRDNGYVCQGGLIYYRETRQRVPLELSAELEHWIEQTIVLARETAASPQIPVPLSDSPKCTRCSLAPVCLPDETRMLSPEPQQSPRPTEPARSGPRRLIAARDEKRALYLNTQGYRVGCSELVLRVKDGERVVDEIRLSDLCHVALFGNVQISTQAVRRLCDGDITLSWFSTGGWFYGITRGHSLVNVQVRIAQFKAASDEHASLALARQFVRGKIHNHRVLFMRNHAQPDEPVRLRLGQAREDALRAASIEELLGIEGAAAATYFAQFDGMLREENDDELPGLEERKRDAHFRFEFSGRNRRPPTDPVNAMLSLAYSLLAKECTVAGLAVGLDPYVGFYHQPRHGRPALALDVMEEFRPLIAESAVITAINNRFVNANDFVRAGRAVNLSTNGRKQFFVAFEQRMNALIIHPVFDYKVSYRRALELQMRILARVLTGEIPEYIPFLTR